METFSALLALCAGNSPVTGEFPAQRPVTQSFDVFLWFATEQTIEQTIEAVVIWDAIVLIMTSLYFVEANYRPFCSDLSVLILISHPWTSIY